jgi:uncharacterized RDD family membrane protein YckC
MDPSSHDELTLDDTTVSVMYQCVCGETLRVKRHRGGECEHCGRRFSPAVLEQGVSDTVTIDMASGDESGPTVAEEDPNIGRRVGHFRIIAPIGRGGMGAVYKALDESLQRFVAIKMLRQPQRASDAPDRFQQLLEEARAQARVNHAHVVHIYYVSNDEATPFFAMELVEGRTLSDRLKEGPLPYDEVIHLGLQIAAALRHAGDYDIVHGDIKPKNILLADQRTAKLSDFGLARRSFAASSRRGVAGTPGYLPPEMIREEPLDQRTDIFSLGAMLFEMTFGALPIEQSESAILNQARIEQMAKVRFPDPWPTDIPAAWRGVLAKMLAEHPDDRYQSYDELIADLKRLRPVAVPAASWFPRGGAWAVDLAIARAAQQLFFVPAAANETLSQQSTLMLFVALVALLVPLLASYLQAAWKTSPGKRLFQIRVVDRHGLTPAEPVLAARMVFQLLPVWAAGVWEVLNVIGLRPLGGMIAIACVLWLLADVTVALISRDGRSLHDRFFRTRVALDTHTGDTANSVR